MNGDSVFDIDWRGLEASLAESDLVAIALRRLEHTGRFGTVDLSGNRVVAFREKALSGEPGLVNAGVYLMRRAAVESVPLKSYSLESEAFPMLAKQGALAGLEGDGNFLDIGVPMDFQEAKTRLPTWTDDYLRRMLRAETEPRGG